MPKKSTVEAKKKSPRRALCIGINDYPYEGNDLNGCVNDANAWAGLRYGRLPSSSGRQAGSNGNDISELRIEN